MIIPIIEPESKGVVMMGFGGILGILLIVIIIWAIFQFSGKNSFGNPFLFNQRNSTSDDENALDILEKRYARGEINSEQYQKMKNDLK